MIIYKLTNIVNGKIYIGQDSKNNTKYLGSGVYLANAQKKHGKENFTKEVIEHCKDIDELNQRERYWIAFYNSTDPKVGYNLSPGGNSTLGWHMTDEQKAAMSKRQRGKKLSPATIAKLKLTGRGKGKKVSQDQREKLKITSSGKLHAEESKRKMREARKLQILKPDTKETRERKSKSHIGLRPTEESLEKMRKARLGTRATEDTKSKLRAEQKKRVDCKRIFNFYFFLIMLKED
jgi:group I intron endonuclease